LKDLFPQVENLAPVALQWILQHPEVSTIIPGASKVEHLMSNLSLYERPDLTSKEIEEMNAVYTEKIKPLVHQKW